ncbi:hypothetical protein ACE1B6_01600 [Aerosakkonemataceae cyanobacterium BLCC-F154]|uniref:Uncharacterized protein n=1 Tax=Floridaenema fluviatile BLCC-F154 TaxID=3153640 RepID=A0ABV4Y559_9CYAN
MSRLQICDLSFCETANGSQVQGGLLANSLLVFDFLGTYIPTFGKQFSEQTGQYLVEQYSDDTGENTGYQISSLDGKQIIAGASGQVNNVDYALSFAQSST